MSYHKHGDRSVYVNILFLKSTGMILVIYLRVLAGEKLQNDT